MPAPKRFLVAAFLAILAGVPLVQCAAEARRGEWPRALEFLGNLPTRENLRAGERDLEAASVTARALRPWMQAGLFFGLREAGEKVFVGRDGWLFYRPGLSYLTQRPGPGDAQPREALDAILDFRDQLAARGVRLILLPVPNKESVYPDKVSSRAAPPARPFAADTRELLALCDRAGIEVVDLFSLYRRARAQSGEPLYLAQDSHWSPAGVKRAAAAVAERVLAGDGRMRGDIAYDVRPASVRRLGDIARMLASPPIEARLESERIAAEPVVRRSDGAPYADDPASPILVLGDSFLRVYEQDDPGHAGFVAHLACGLARPLASIGHDGGATTLVRQELCRRPQWLAGKKVVIWEFVERDIRLGTEGWKRIELPGHGRSAQP